MHNPGASRRGIVDSRLGLSGRHCERSEAIQRSETHVLDCFAPLAKTGNKRTYTLYRTVRCPLRFSAITARSGRATPPMKSSAIPP